MLINKILLEKAFELTVEEYFQKTSINGFGLLYYIRRRKYQRVFWFISILCSCCFAAYVPFIYVKMFLDNPTVVTLENYKQATNTQSLPAIGFCNVNKISRIRVQSMAEEFSRRTNLSASHWFQKFKFLGSYFNHNEIDLDEAIDFELELRKLLGEHYDIPEFLKSLAPPCEELLKECHFDGKQRNCSDIFKSIATVIGYCCIFNRRERFSKSTTYLNKAEWNSISVILNASSADYFCKGRNINGFFMQIFDSHNLPDVTTGGVFEIMIPPETDTVVEISTVTQTSESSIRKFGHSQRRCYFEDESVDGHKVGVSQPECYNKCRTEKSLAVCLCVPYHTPQEYLEEEKENVRICSLMDLECLGDYWVSWHTFRSKEMDLPLALVPNGLECDHCHALCTFTTYYYQKQRHQLKKTLNTRKNRKFLENFRNNSADLSIVRINMMGQKTVLYSKKELFNWFQIISNVGGVLGISIGCSIISGFEILYFFVFRFYSNILKLRKIECKN